MKRNRKREGIRNKKEIIQLILDGDFHKAAEKFPFVSNNINKTVVMEDFFASLHKAITNQEKFLLEVNRGR